MSRLNIKTIAGFTIWAENRHLTLDTGVARFIDQFADRGKLKIQPFGMVIAFAIFRSAFHNVTARMALDFESNFFSH